MQQNESLSGHQNAPSGVWSAVKPGKKRLMDTISFSNRERILIGNSDEQYMSFLQQKLPKADYSSSVSFDNNFVSQQEATSGK